MRSIILDRRGLIVGAAAAAAGVALVTVAQPARTVTGGAPSDFLKATRRVTGRAVPDGDRARRLYNALIEAAQVTPKQVADVAALGSGPVPAELQGAAFAIQKAWYSGMVGRKVILFEDALALAAVAPILTPRSYAGGPPGYWAAAPSDPKLGQVSLAAETAHANR